MAGCGRVAWEAAPEERRMREHKVILDIDGDVATLRLNDPARLNALSTDMVEAITLSLRQAERSARALVLCGAGTSFCSGANLAGELANAEGAVDFDGGLILETHINPMMLALRDLCIPWISAVRGAAAGVGASLALAADLIVAGDNAYFLQAFRRIGLVPDGGSTYLLTRAAGRPRAMEMMLLGEKLPAAKALEWGLINRVVPDAEVEATAQGFARELAEGPTRALALIRKIAWRAADSDFHTALAEERTHQAEAGRTSDFREGVRAFLDKRPARFTGT